MTRRIIPSSRQSSLYNDYYVLSIVLLLSMYTSSPDSQSRFQLPVFLSFRLTLLTPLSPTTIHLPLRVLRHTTSYYNCYSLKLNPTIDENQIASSPFVIRLDGPPIVEGRSHHHIYLWTLCPLILLTSKVADASLSPVTCIMVNWKCGL